MIAGSEQIESKKQLQYRSPILPQDEMMSASYMSCNDLLAI